MATVSPSSPSWSYALQLPHDPRAPGIARATLRTVLAAHDLAHLTPAAELLASELLTNAHLYTRGPYALRLLSNEPDRLRVAVWDADPWIPPGFRASRKGAPVVVPPDDAEGGRGLHLVRACADSWGVSVPREFGAPEGGKLLWAECGRTEVTG